jgi:hypothetical protein
MTTGPQILDLIGQRRKAICDMVVKNPEQFCVCEGCSAILKLPTGRECHFCKAYRFDETRERVLAVVAESGARAISLGCPVLPRYVAEMQRA